MKFNHQEPIDSRKGWTRLIGYIVVVIIIFGIIGWFGVTRWYNYNLQPVDSAVQTTQTFIIEPGTSVRNIAEALEQQGIIRNASVFAWFVNRSDTWSDLQAGTYSLGSNMTVETIVEKLATGDIDTTLVTIFPGRRLDQVSEDLHKAGYSDAEVAKAMAAKYSNPILASRPAGSTLEGYIFPDTYQVRGDMTLEDLFSRSFNELDENITTDHRQALKAQGLSLHEAVILASIVGLEDKDPDEQKRIAGVFLNRLEAGMTLGADPTFKYAAAIAGEEASPDIRSPYNTRIIVGLPPGPIGNFNFSAFDAVAFPAKGDFLFFVTGDDGQFHYAKTLEEHEANVADYCSAECQ